jgi:hypothetical protein
MHGNRCYVKSGRERPHPHILWVRDQKFAEPVSLSSTALADFPLPGRALELGFDLLGSRARRKQQSMGAEGALQGVAQTQTSQFAEIQLSTFPQQTVQLVEKPGAPTRIRFAGMHFRMPSMSRGTVSFLWGFFLGLYIWLGMVAVGFTGATSFIFGAVSGFGIFLFVFAYGRDEPERRTRRAGPPA